LNTTYRDERNKALSAFIRQCKNEIKKTPQDLPLYIAYALGAAKYAHFIGDIDADTEDSVEDDLYSYLHDGKGNREGEEV
jgi:hypothetical protein